MEKMIKDFNYIVSFISPRLQMYIQRLSVTTINDIQEIRIRADRPVVVVSSSGCSFLTSSGKTSYILSSNCVYAYKNEISDTVNKMCGYSMHSHYEDLINGYVTLPNGCRVGLCGTAVYDKDKVKGIKEIDALNIRIPRNITGISEDIMNTAFKDGPENLMIVGAPSSGKTTMLKDIVFQLSSGRLGKYYKVCVIDERKEIFPNKSNFEYLGPNTDVLSGYPKAQGIEIATRTLSPDIIICDEIGQRYEINEIINGLNSGIKFVLSAHASSIEEFKNKEIYNKLFIHNDFKSAVFLVGSNKPSTISKILNYDNLNENYIDFDDMPSSNFVIKKAN